MRHITDVHVHVWDLSRFSLPWLDDVPALKKSISEDDYMRDMGQGPGWRIEKAVYVEVDVAPEQREQEAEYIARVCREQESAFEAAVISADLALPEAARRLGAYRDHPCIRGVRHVLHVDSSPKGACLDTTFVRNVRILGEQGMLFEGCLRTSELSDLVQLAKQCPDTPVVLDHMGNVDPVSIAAKNPTPEQAAYADQWKRDIEALGALPNVSCKISGLNVFGDWSCETLAPALEHCFDVFGEDRIMFASNYPVCQLSLGARPWVEALLSITAARSESFQAKLFSGNAARIYQLQR